MHYSSSSKAYGLKFWNSSGHRFVPYIVLLEKIVWFREAVFINQHSSFAALLTNAYGSVSNKNKLVLSWFCSLLSGWSHWLWRICCHDDQGQYGGRAKNNEKQPEHQYEGRTWCNLDFRDVHTACGLSFFLPSPSSKTSCNFRIL